MMEFYRRRALFLVYQRTPFNPFSYCPNVRWVVQKSGPQNQPMWVIASDSPDRRWHLPVPLHLRKSSQFWVGWIVLEMYKNVSSSSYVISKNSLGAVYRQSSKCVKIVEGGVPDWLAFFFFFGYPLLVISPADPFIHKPSQYLRFQ